MRTAREKMPVSESGCYYHLMNRVAGQRGSRPLGDVDRERGMRLVARICEYYLLEPVSVCWMGNHFHIVLYAPSDSELPPPAEIAERHNAFHKNKPLRHISPNDKAACLETGRKMLDISRFMKDLQQQYTFHYNRMRDRRGHLWGDRFKSVILERGDALWTAVKYVALNPVRAGIAANPADYRHCSWGWKAGSGKHPFDVNFVKHMRASLGEAGENLDAEEIFALFRSELARIIASESGFTASKTQEKSKKASKGDTMPTRFLRRVRHWSDGGIIGSKEFVRETAAKFRDRKRVEQKRLSKGQLDGGGAIYCFKRLRTSDY